MTERNASTVPEILEVVKSNETLNRLTDLELIQMSTQTNFQAVRGGAFSVLLQRFPEKAFKIGPPSALFIDGTPKAHWSRADFLESSGFRG